MERDSDFGSSWDAEVSAVVVPYNGRWPTQGERQVGCAAGARGCSAQLAALRWVRWDQEERTLSVGVGRPLASLDRCHEVFIYLPK